LANVKLKHVETLLVSQVGSETNNYRLKYAEK